MRTLFYRPCSLRSLGAALALLAGVLLAPAAARAGCGEHVVVIASLENNVPMSAPAPPTTPAKKHAPCSGPHCTRSPLAPPPAPLVPVGPGGSDVARILEPLLLPANHSVPCPRESPREHAIFLASSVYHPPR
ncbi:MAG TPA: hypothetical protein VMF69_13340 [Gemmataceae bacterium]|nr:hypothetical protein [Gemmataceae bacterium]